MAHATPRRLFLSLSAALVAVLGAIGCSRAADVPPSGLSGPLAAVLTANDGKPYPLAQHKGKVLLIVNTASRCGFTKQYAGLEKLWQTYRERGLVVIGVPSNDFMGQEPGSDAEILSFCQSKYGVTFPLMHKVVVKGAGQDPLFTWLTVESPKPGAVSWNFNKFLIGRDGSLIERYGSRTAPEDKELLTAIDAALGTPGAP